MDWGPPGGRVRGKPLFVSMERAVRTGVAIEIVFHVHRTCTTFFSVLLVATKIIVVFVFPLLPVVIAVIRVHVVCVYLVIVPLLLLLLLSLL